MITYAESGGDEKKIKVLYIKQRADRLISTERLALEKLAQEKAERAEKLEQIQVKTDGFADPRLVAAVWDGNWACASKLLREGVKLLGTDENGESLSDLAKKRGDKQMIRLLESYHAVARPHGEFSVFSKHEQILSSTPSPGEQQIDFLCLQLIENKPTYQVHETLLELQKQDLDLETIELLVVDRLGVDGLKELENHVTILGKIE